MSWLPTSFPHPANFKVRFNHMQSQIDDIKGDIKDFRGDVNKRFDEAKVDMNGRFEQVNKRLEQIIASIDRLGNKLDYRTGMRSRGTLP